MRLLVQCSPYGRLLDQQINDLQRHFQSQYGMFSLFAIMVHQTGIGKQDKEDLLHGHGGHTLLLRADEIERLRDLVKR